MIPMLIGAATVITDHVKTTIRRQHVRQLAATERAISSVATALAIGQLGAPGPLHPQYGLFMQSVERAEAELAYLKARRHRLQTKLGVKIG